MYDEQIKRLRNCATQAAPCKTCDMIEDDSCIDTLMKQAADAIEAMNYELKSLYKLLGTHPDPRGENGEAGVPYNRATEVDGDG